MSRRATALRRTAIHEAGHAVIAHAVGARIHRATIKADKENLGAVHCGRILTAETAYANDDRARLRFERNIKISLAGAIATRRAFPGSRWRSGAGEDDYAVGTALAHVYPSLKKGDDGWRAQGHFLELMKIETEWLLARHWHCVEAVAEQLLARTTMSGSQIKETIFRAWDEDLARRIDKQKVVPEHATA